MRRFFISEEQGRQAADGAVVLTGTDVNHIVHVLRMQTGDWLTLSTTDGRELICQIDAFSDQTVTCKVQTVHQNQTEPQVAVTLLQGIPKGEKMELIVQKSVELGAANIIPVQMERTIVRFHTGQDAIKKQGRWQKVSEEAAKQCGRGTVPSVEAVQSLQTAIQTLPEDTLRLVAYEHERDYSLKARIREAKAAGDVRRIAVLIGPEGGISPAEFDLAVAAGFASVSLGKRILRTETAGISVLAAIRYEFED